MGTRVKGSINIYFLTILSSLLIIILFAFCIMYVQMSSTILNIKNDLYSIIQNGIIANDKEELAVENYTAKENMLRQYIGVILDNNYIKEGSSIKSITIEECNYIIDKNAIKLHTSDRYRDPIIHIRIQIKFTPIIKIQNILEKITITVHEDVKATLMNYGGT